MRAGRAHSLVIKTDTNGTKMTKPVPKASDYTHSVWSGKKYGKVQTDASLLAESKSILARHQNDQETYLLSQ